MTHFLESPTVEREPRAPAEAAAHPRRRGLLPAGELGWTPYVWLVYLSVFLVDPAVRAREGTLTPGVAVLTALGLAVFLVSYFRGFWASGRGLLLVIAVEAMLGVAFAPINPGSSVLFVYAASFAGHLERTRQAVGTILLVAAACLLTTWLAPSPPYLAVSAVIAAIIGGVNLQQAQVRRANARLRLAQEQIEEFATVAERERIARDLHDLLGHTLSLIVLKSELAAKLIPRSPERAAREIADVEQVSRKALQEVREAIGGYRPSLAEEVVRSRTLLRAAGIRARIGPLVDSRELGREVEATMAFALREAVTNVVRHSRAAECRVRLERHSGAWVLGVEDDGHAGALPEGGGLRGMRERVEALGGTVSRGFPAAAGFRLEVRLPASRETAPTGSLSGAFEE